MCTVSCFPWLAPAFEGDAPVRLRVVFSRDELRARLPAFPPLDVVRGARRVLMPRDADAGGTWIAVNDAGVVFTLLNLYSGHNERPAHRVGSPRLRTRGTVIEHLVEAITASQALERMDAIDADAVRPFRVLACDRIGSVMEAVWDGASISRSLRSLDVPLMRTSSSLGDAVVIRPRRALFHTLLRESRRPTAATQDAFHHHYWPGARELSVRMSRPDARTVSITTVEVRDSGVRMLYHELAHVGTHDGYAPGPPAGPHTETIRAKRVVNA
jgi:hypothetical protein